MKDTMQNTGELIFTFALAFRIPDYFLIQQIDEQIKPHCFIQLTINSSMGSGK